MKDQLLNVVIGTVLSAAKMGGVQASASLLEDMSKPENWELVGTKFQIINTTTFYLFEFMLSFLQVELVVENTTVVRINLVTDEFKRIKYDEPE